MNYPGKIRIIGGRFRSRKITVVNQSLLRPTPDRVRETLFNWLQDKMVNARCLDCFAGSGILGFEALSRGAQQVTMIDSSRGMSSELIKTRLDLGLSDEQCLIFEQDTREWIKKHAFDKDILPYDIIFLDPPFNSDLLALCLNNLVSSSLIAKEAWIYIEMPSTLSALNVHPQWKPFKSKIAGQVGYHLLEKV